ncbi:MAG TPA: hypothetical protein DDZ80_02365 [Cyanobacteria bacterium UBA8803]|nr:hypothetical protein [Cyanobacteria bacterium UBA9273]HBL57428.1 hypothetical protein [Cyanobacteria bacterium UBA8803]
MVEDKPRYELHFHGLVQDSVVFDSSKVKQVFQGSWTRSTAVHQLSSDLADFTGRQTELDRLTAYLLQATASRGTGNSVAVVTGMAGVGKSALALHLAHELNPNFPDAQLYVNLRGTEGQPLEPLEVLAGFLRALGVDDPLIPQSLTERSELYRSLLSNKRALVLLDNARDEFQIRPLLPDCATCAVLVTTSRHLPALEEAMILDLPVMTDTEARSLLQKLVGVERTTAEPEATQQILDLCDRLPLAIRITGGILRTSPDWRLAYYASKLAERRQRLIQLRLGDLDVRTSLTLSYQELEALPARLFRLLGLLVGLNFVPGVAAALLESEPVIAEESFQTLVDRQLVELTSEGRYRFHDSVRLFARGQLAQEEPAEARQAARLRISRYYLETTEIWDLALNLETRRQLTLLLVKGKDQSFVERNLLLAALNWFEMERPNLLASVEWAHQAEAWTIVISLTRNLVNFFNTHNYWADWERTHWLALEASRELGTRQGEAQTLINLGNVYSLKSHWEKASNCYEQSLGIFSELSDRPGVAKSLSNLGNVYAQQGYWEKAINSYQESLSLFDELKDRYREGQTLANMGIVYAQQNDKDRAILFWQDSLTKLHPDLSKSKRVAEWLQSIKGNLEVSLQANQIEPQRHVVYLLGGLIVMILALFLLIIFW